MQPKLRGDTLYLPIGDSIYFQNDQQSLKLKGQDLYQWVEILEPYLNGQYSLDDIISDLMPEQQKMIQELTETLLQHGFLKDLSLAQPHTLDEHELRSYAPEITFLEAFGDSAAAIFEQFRKQRILLIGSGLTALALVQATLQGGTQQVTVWVTDECETFTQRFQAYREQALARDPHQVLLEQPAPDWHDSTAVQEALQPFDVILHLSDRTMLRRALMLNTLCIALQKPLFQALILDDQALIGPWVRPGQAGCWECAWRRWLANLDAPQKNERDLWEDDRTTPVSVLLGLPTAATVANMLSFECFKALTGAGPSGITETLLQLDLETLRSQSHRFLPHPLCQACQHPLPASEATFVAQIHVLEEQEPTSIEAFDQQVVPCFDPALGIFRSLGEDTLVQMPLNVSSLTLSAPEFPRSSQGPITITCARVGTDTARRDLALQGLACYASSMVDQRQLIATATGAQTWAYDLFTKHACLVPGEHAYPLGEFQALSSSFLGVSAGLSWAEACVRASLDHCLMLTLQEALLGEISAPEIPLSALPLDELGEHLLRLVKQTGKPLQIYDLTGRLGIPTFAFCVGDETLVYTTHPDTTQALHEGLERVVQHFQALHEEQSAYALPPVSSLPGTMRGAPGLLLASSIPGTWKELLEWLVARLHRHHWQLLALPLNHDLALTEILPFLVRVILVPQEEMYVY